MRMKSTFKTPTEKLGRKTNHISITIVLMSYLLYLTDRMFKMETSKNNFAILQNIRFMLVQNMGMGMMTLIRTTTLRTSRPLLKGRLIHLRIRNKLKKILQTKKEEENFQMTKKKEEKFKFSKKLRSRRNL
jgi:hypothetical protein